MKKISVIFLMLLHISLSVSAMKLDTKVKLLPADQLQKSFEQEDLGGFARETKICEYLDSKELSLGLAENIANTYRMEYLDVIRKTYPGTGIETFPDLLKKDKILECILRGASILEKTDNHLHDIKTMYRLPDKYKLKEIIKEVTSEFFVKSSKIHKQLGYYAELSKTHIIAIIDACIEDYECPPITSSSEVSRDAILKAVLSSSYEREKQAKL